VQVLRDRRAGERRRARASWTAERRPVDDELASIGFAVARIE
jgi:hypothetical protein